MNTSAKSEYALRAMFDLANQRQPVLVKIAEIADRQRIPFKYLQVILAGLKRGGFVQARRGADGGYTLARPADKITVGELLRFVEGTPASHSNGLNGTDPVKIIRSEIDSAICGIVDRMTLAQLVQRWRESVNEYVPSWDI